MLEKYILKHTYFESGNEYFITKGGYVTDHPETLPLTSCFTSKKSAQATATRYNNRCKLSVNDHSEKNSHYEVYKI